MAGGGMGVSWMCFALLTVATAGPLHRVPRESEDYQNDLSAYANYTANEVCFSEGEVFQKGDVMPNPGPCEECRCEPPSIVCNMIKCPVNNNGCRTIQRANHCCPDYNCECDYNGQLYNDGERLDLPEEPCQVCYCKGGEVMCNSITCYHRDDCDPVQVEGQCCPKYDNCPVRDMGSSSAEDKNVLVRSTNKTNYVPPKREMNPWLLTKIPPPSSPSPPKAQNPSTEGSGVIIVSDWLTERRTTTEDGGRPDYSVMFTDVPDMSSTSGQSSGPAIVKSQDTFTPVDEVIFTRIDGENVNKEANVESTTIPSKPEDKLTSTDTNITGDPVGSKNDENLKGFNSSKSPMEKQDISEVRPLDVIVNTSTTTESSIKIEKLSMNSSFGVSSQTSDKNQTSIDGSTSKPVFEEAEKVTTYNDENDAIVGNILDLDGLSIGEDESETTTKDELDYSSTLSEDFTSRFIDVNENSIENQTKGESKVGQVKLSQDEIKTTFERFSGTTPSSGIGDDATTPFFTEVSLGKQSLDNNDEPTGLPKIKIGGDQTSNKNDTMTSTTDHESSTNEITLPPVTETAETKSPVEVKIKRNNLNDTGVRGNSTEKTGSPITLNSNESEITSTSQVAEMKNANVNNLNLGKATPSSEAKEISLPTSSENETNFGLETTSDIPPVLELNSNVPFLQLGGHENTDNDDNTTDESNETTPTFQTEISIAVTDSVSNLTSDNLNRGSLKETNATLVSADVVSKTLNNNQSKSEEIKKSEVGNEKLQSETTTDAVFPTTHIPLTPGDLRIIAEYLINDTIKTVPVNNESDYAPNSWLKGNLTSEEKMTSILSAANVSIAIMNKTDDKVKKIMTDPTEKPGSDVKSGRFEKEKVSGNNALNDLKIGNKTGFIRGKGDAYSDSPKINPDHEAPLNDDAKASEAGNVVSNTTNKLIKEATLTTSTTTSVEQTSSSQMNKDSGYNLSFDKVNPGRAEAKQDSRDVPLQSDKLSGETTTTDLPQKLSAH